MKTRPAILIVLDGWGIAPKSTGNAIENARKPFFDSLIRNFPHTELSASGEDVGLPEGEAGNSEVGHLNLGSGRVVLQDLTKINKSIKNGDFFKNSTLLETFEHVKANNSQLHLFGLVGSGTVHSSNDHLYALLIAAKQHDFEDVNIHIFTDGRDSPPTQGIELIDEIESKLGQIGLGTIASVTGRFWSMARDNHWDRTEKTYQMMVENNTQVFARPKEVFELSYRKKVFDEFIEPSLINIQGETARIKNDDAVIFFNFRKDRPRQLTKAFVLPEFKDFGRKTFLNNLKFTTMTQYEKDLPVSVLFPQENISQTLTEVFSQEGYKQLHIGESEKYAHVTYFFNGGVEKPFPGEDRVHIPSPRVKTYDLKPEMSANEITQKLIESITEEKYSLIVVNFANADMVGHTGSISATIKATETLDKCLERITNEVLSKDALLFITADHGNAEEKLDKKTGEFLTEHSKNKVPLIVIGSEFKNSKIELNKGILGDVAPTVLALTELQKPKEMTGKNLVKIPSSSQ